jgi:hypothetical protein
LFGSFLNDCCFLNRVSENTVDKVDWRVSAGLVRLHRGSAPRRLTARPAESELPEAEINHFMEQSLRKQPIVFINSVCLFIPIFQKSSLRDKHLCDIFVTTIPDWITSF